MTTPYTEEDAAAAEQVIVAWARDRIASWGLATGDHAERLAANWAVGLAPLILAALAAAGRLVPPGSETREEWGCEPRWPVHKSEPVHWPNELAARAHQRDAGGDCRVVRRLVTPWSPSVPDTKEET